MCSFGRETIKKTKKRLGIQKIFFFQSDSKNISAKNKIFKTRFSQKSTRYIFAEIEFNNKLYKIDNLKTNILLIFSNKKTGFTKKLKGVINQKRDAVTLFYQEGIKWPKNEKWPAGNYMVDIIVHNIYTGNANFEIYE